MPIMRFSVFAAASIDHLLSFEIEDDALWFLIVALVANKAIVFSPYLGHVPTSIPAVEGFQRYVLLCRDCLDYFKGVNATCTERQC